MTRGWHPVADVSEGLALEARAFSASDPVAALWQSAEPALVCPKAYRKRDGFAEAVERSAARGWPVALRPTGGGTVPQTPGGLNLVMALTIPQIFGIAEGYRLLCEPIIALGRDLGLHLRPGATPDSFCDGDWNLSSRGRKMVGTAQRLRPLRQGRVRMLAHALILTEGPVGPGAAAVDAFHRDLGLAPVRAEVHTTLNEELGPRMPSTGDLVRALYSGATRTLADAGLD